MKSAGPDRACQQGATKIVSAEITDGPGPLPNGVFEQAPRVIATLDDGSLVELFSFYAHERSFSPAEFVGLTVEQGRHVKFAPYHRPRVDGSLSARCKYPQRRG
jgi:hypothetical protein